MIVCPRCRTFCWWPLRGFSRRRCAGLDDSFWPVRPGVQRRRLKSTHSGSPRRICVGTSFYLLGAAVPRFECVVSSFLCVVRRWWARPTIAAFAVSRGSSTLRFLPKFSAATIFHAVFSQTCSCRSTRPCSLPSESELFRLSESVAGLPDDDDSSLFVLWCSPLSFAWRFDDPGSSARVLWCAKVTVLQESFLQRIRTFPQGREWVFLLMHVWLNLHSF